MKFCATRAAPDGDYNEVFEADSWKDAREYCRARGWTLGGEIKATVQVLPDWLVALWNRIRGERK